MFSLDRFLAECHAANQESDAPLAMRECIARAVSKPSEVIDTLGEPTKGGTTVLHHSDELTVLNIVWPPEIEIFPHDHHMWAVIGIYGGIEDNTFYRRVDSGLEPVTTKRLGVGNARTLGHSTIHSVANPKLQPTAAIHVYGGDFFAAKRSEFDPDTFDEKPYDLAHANAVFREANQRWLESMGA